MMSLTENESKVLYIFREFDLISGEIISINSIFAKEELLKPNIVKDIDKYLSSLVDKGLICQRTHRNYSLTEYGEQILYGEFKLKQAANEVLEIFKHFKATAGSVINEQNILCVRDKFLSPLSKKRQRDIFEYLQQEGLIQRKQNYWMLTKEGEDILYNNN